MLKSVLVAVDDTPPSKTAQAVAIDLCKRLDARIAGIGVLDRPWITAPQAIPLGASHYKYARDRTLIERFDAEIDALLKGFEKRCKKAGVSFAAAEWQGDPAERIEVESEAHDLIVLGKDTTFHFELAEENSQTVTRLARDDPRPLIVTPAKAPRSGKILVACDGSLAASRSMHMFALLGLAAGGTVEVVTVTDGSADDARARATQAAKVFANHAVEATVTVVETDDHPADVLVERAADAALLVMGAFGRRQLRDVFFGSCTTRLLEACPVPLFIHH